MHSHLTSIGFILEGTFTFTFGNFCHFKIPCFKFIVFVIGISLSPKLVRSKEKRRISFVDPILKHLCTRVRGMEI